MLSLDQQAAWTARAREAQTATGATPEQAQRDQVQRVKFFEYFKALNEKLLQRQQSLWRAYYMTWLRSALYYDGKQVLVPRSGFGYDIRQLKGIDHPIYVYNKLRPYSDEVTSMWVQSHPEVLFAVLDENERRAQKAIDEIETLNGYFNHLHLTEENLQLTAKGGQFCGNYHFEVWFDPNEKNGWEWIEEYKPVNVPESMWYECLDCGEIGEMPENATCQACGSEMITPNAMPAVNFETLDKAEWQQAGDVICRPFPAWSQRYSLTTGPDNSPWRYAEEDLPKEIVEATYGKLDGTADDQRWGEDEAMHPERIMRRAQRQRAGYESEDDMDNVLTQRFWFEPEMLAWVALQEDATLPDGNVIPAGERLSDVFPGGMCILTAPGLPRFLAVTEERHRERFIDGRYGITTGVKIGHGYEDGVENQRQTNLLRSGIFRYMQKTLQPSIAVNNRVFQNTQLFNRLDNVISINNATLPEGSKVGDHFAHVVPPAVNPQAFGILEQLDADMQAALKAYNSSGDFAGVENNTATAAKIGVAKAASAHNLHLALYAGVIKELAVRRIALAQKHYQNLRLVQAVDTLTGERKAKVINSLNIRLNVVAWIKTGSFMPNLEMEKRAAFVEGVNAISMLAPLNLLNPASIRQINELFKTDFSFERQAERIEECEEALDLMLEAFEMSGGMALPADLYALAPVDPLAIGHEAKLQWWRELRSSKEGRKLPPAVFEAIGMEIEAEFAAIIQEQQYTAMAAGAGQALLAMAGQPAQGPGGEGKKNEVADSRASQSVNPMAADVDLAIASNPVLGPLNNGGLSRV